MTKNAQRQKVGNNSTSLQVGGDMYLGMTYSDVKEIALDVFKNNFYQLSEEAGKIARLRAEELTEDFLKKVQLYVPENIIQMADPGMQYALLTAQMEYAKSGDKELSEILQGILIKRIAEQDRNMKQIVLNEALSIVSKLTSKQLDILCFIFFIREMTITKVKDINTLKGSIDAYIIPIIPDLEKKDVLSNFRHLDYLSCISISYITTGESTLLNFFRKIPNLFVRENFLDFKDKAYVDEETETKLKELPEGTMLPDDLMKKYLFYLSPEMENLFDLWDNTLFESTRLTSVGILLGNMRLSSKTEIDIDISNLIK